MNRRKKNRNINPGCVRTHTHEAPCVGLAVDESTNVSTNVWLLVYVRFFNKEAKDFCEDLLGVTSLQTSTRGENIYQAIKMMLLKRGTEPEQVVSVPIDGATAMVGRERSCGKNERGQSLTIT